MSRPTVVAVGTRLPEDIPWDQPVTLQDCANDYNSPEAAQSRALIDKAATREPN